MQHSELENNVFPRFAGKAGLLGGVLMAFLIAGCGGSTTKQTSTTTSTPQTYFAPYVAGTTYYYGTSASLETPLTYTMDDAGGTFSQTAYGLSGTPGSQVLNAGVFSVGQSGLRNLSMETYYVSNGNVDAAYIAETYTPFQPAFAVELADQTGGLVQLHGQPVAPLVAATECPNFTTAQTYQFLTIPAPLSTTVSANNNVISWDPTAETAYGSVDISSSGSTVTLDKISQFILPSEGGTKVSTAPSSATGACGSTSYGNITVTPGQLVITDPGNGQIVPPQAKIGIGVNSGFLMEDDQATGTLVSTSGVAVSPYNNTLGAGTGAVGLPKPSSDITSAVVGAQYLGFIYGAGEVNSKSTVVVPWSSHLASFSYSSASSGCTSFAAQITAQGGTPANPIYGGDYTNDDPTTYTSSNCNFAIDLGAAQTSNGLYTNATVWMGANYAANTTGKAYSFKAVAIAGQIDKKNAIFVLGVDSTQPWAIYLLQSN